MIAVERDGRAPATIAVLGGGVAGLAAATTLRRAGLEVELFEAADKVGGVIQSEMRGGFLAETGPNSLAAPPEPVVALLEELGLSHRRVAPRASASNRFIVKDGGLRALPHSPGDLLRSDLLSASGKLRLLKEPFVGRAATGSEETVADFVRRRFGREALDYLADPFVAGIFAGDPERLSMRHALPKIHALEAAHGSVMKGAIFGDRPSSGGPSLFSFPGGMAELPQAMGRLLGHRVHCNSMVSGVRRVGDGWYLTGDRAQLDPLRRYDGLVLALPAHRMNGMIWEGFEATRLLALAGVRYLPVATLVLGFRRAAVRHPLDGFGMLVPKLERRRILGTIFSSSLFDDRAPEGHVTLTTLVGGARLPALALAGSAAVKIAVLNDLEPLLGITEPPVFERFHCWPKAIPQYDLGYGAYLEQAAAAEAEQPGLVLAGNYRDGLSVGDTVMSGLTAGTRLAARLSRVGVGA